MPEIGKFIYVVCLQCEFLFACAGEYVYPHMVTHPRSELDSEMLLRCSKCKHPFKLEESKLKAGMLPQKIPVSLKDLR